MTQALIAKIKALREVAEKATPGPWKVERHDMDDGSISYEVWHTATVEHYTRVVTFNAEYDDENAKANSYHVAGTNPSAMIALYDEMLKVLEHKEDGK